MIPDREKLIRNLTIRSKVIQAIRDYFVSQKFMEIETPIRCPFIIPEAQIDPFDSEGYYLQASPELCMKRMVSKSGCNRIFQICKSFRKEERGAFHLPEFTLLEWYCTNSTYLDLMIQCQELINHIALKLTGENRLNYQGSQIKLVAPWKQLTVKNAFLQYTDTSAEAAIHAGKFDEYLSFDIEPNLGLDFPLFLTDYPAPLASLAKLKSDDPTIAQRFELYIAGIELANGFTELTDPIEQENRFLLENQIRTENGKPTLPMPKKFLKDLEEMAPTAGIALGVDRLVMLFCDTQTIDDVVTFTPESH